MSKAPEKSKKYEERLMDMLGFDEADLEANQVGQISRHQLDRLKSERKRLALYWVAGMLFSAVVLALALVGIGAFGSLSATAATGILLVIGAMILGFCFYFGTGVQRINQDMDMNRVSQVEGRVDLSLSTKQNDAKYFLHVDGMRFSLKQKTFLAFKNGDPYRIYYAPRSKEILATEWLRENDDNLIEENADEAPALMDDEGTSSQTKQA